MPLKSLRSSVPKWPDNRTVGQAAKLWAQRLGCKHPEILGIAYFGSYAREDWGVGSDLDVVIIVTTTKRPFEERGRDIDTRELPVPSNVLVYTLEEWGSLKREQPFFQRVLNEAVWVYGSPENLD